LDRLASGHTEQRADHWPKQNRQPLHEHGSRHAGLDPCGSGKSIARIISGLQPEVDFAFIGKTVKPAVSVSATTSTI
jgi:hypothetical protein